MSKIKLSNEDLKYIAQNAVMAARENAFMSIHENYSRAEVISYGGTDAHPKFDDLYNTTLNGILESLQSQREYSDWAPRVLSDREIKTVQKYIR